MILFSWHIARRWSWHSKETQSRISQTDIKNGFLPRRAMVNHYSLSGALAVTALSPITIPAIPTIKPAMLW